jgi:hypothetical protein
VTRLIPLRRNLWLNVAIVAFVVSAVLALWATLSPSIRRAASLSELATA